MLKDLFLAFVRHALTLAAGAIGLEGLTDGDGVQALVAGAVAAVGLLWSFGDKWLRASGVVPALALALVLPLIGACAGLVPHGGLTDRQALAAAEVVTQDLFNEIGFLHSAGQLSDRDIDAMRPYAEAVMAGLREARQMVMTGKPAGDAIGAANRALQSLILDKQRRQKLALLRSRPGLVEAAL